MNVSVGSGATMTANNRGKKILLVDDDPGLLRLLSIRLRAERYEVEALTANSNVAGLAKLAIEFNAKFAAVADATLLGDLQAALAGTGIACGAGESAVIEAAARPSDWVMAAVAGIRGDLGVSQWIARTVARFIDEGLLDEGLDVLDAAAGIVDVVGEFEEGDVVEVRNAAGVTFARGIVSADSTVLRSVRGRRTSDLPGDVAHEAVHRDDLLVLSSRG